MRAGARVLVDDDDPTVAEIVSGYLDRAGYFVTGPVDGPDAPTPAAAHRPDLAVLDPMLPGMDGLEACRRIRAQGPVPVVMLTAPGDEDDRILGLGGRLRHQALQSPWTGPARRVRAPPRPPHGRGLPPSGRGLGRPAERSPARGRLTVDPAARRAVGNGTELALIIHEFGLLAFFLRHPGRGVWGSTSGGQRPKQLRYEGLRPAHPWVRTGHAHG